MPSYTHTLIPDDPQYVPNIGNVQAFFRTVISMESAPINAEILARTFTGEYKTVTNPFNGTISSFPKYDHHKLKNISEIEATIGNFNDYAIRFAGSGPTRIEPLKLDFIDTYFYSITCCVRNDIVSTSDWHDEIPLDRKVEFFNSPCSVEDRIGIFHNPETLAVIKVPNAGCGRFRVEFEFGKMLFPKIADCLDLIEPSILQAAEDCFGVKFNQGCVWCA